MKKLNQFIVERLKITKDTKLTSLYRYHPKNKDELINIINTEIANQSQKDIVDLSGIDMTNLRDIDTLFGDVQIIKKIKLNLSDWDMSNIESANNLFYYDSNIISLNVSNWVFNDKYVEMKSIFNGCSNLEEIIGLDTWNVSSFSTFGTLFSGCYKLTKIDLSNWDVSSAKSFQGMFTNCGQLESVGDLSKWTFSNHAKFFGNMFYGCSKLKTLGDLSKWNMRGSSFYKMFGWCENLNYIGDISNWNMVNAHTTTGMFHHCKNLKDVGNLLKWQFSTLLTQKDSKDMFKDSPLEIKYKVWGKKIIKQR